MKFMDGRSIRYISKLISKDGEVDSARYKHWYNDVLGVVYNSETEEHSEPMKFNLLPYDVLGFDVTLESSVKMLVRHNQKTAMFHRYAFSSGVSTIDVDKHRKGCDFLCLDSSVGMKNKFCPGNREIAIDTFAEAIGVRGSRGSVCYRSRKENVSDIRVLTLYDLMLELCRESGVNLLRYDTITLFSELRNRAARVRLSHDAESEKFYTKMCLDVMSHEV